MVPKSSTKGVPMVDTREESMRKREEPLANVLSTSLGWYVTALASRRGKERETEAKRGDRG